MVARRETSGTECRSDSALKTRKKMPSTHTSLHCHIVFSTKERMAMISDEWRGRLHGYLGGIVNGLQAVPLAIGGVNDHVHLLARLKSSHRIDYFVRDLKGRFFGVGS